jgi:hypothetical protein
MLIALDKHPAVGGSQNLTDHNMKLHVLLINTINCTCICCADLFKSLEQYGVP